MAEQNHGKGNKLSTVAAGQEDESAVIDRSWSSGSAVQDDVKKSGTTTTINDSSSWMTIDQPIVVAVLFGCLLGAALRDLPSYVMPLAFAGLAIAARILKDRVAWT